MPKADGFGTPRARRSVDDINDWIAGLVDLAPFMSSGEMIALSALL